MPIIELQRQLATLFSALLLLQAQAAEIDKKISPLERWVEDLAMCESSNNPSKINYHDPDTRSSGWLQYKDDTFLEFTKKYNFFPGETDKQILGHILEKQTQKTLVMTMVKDNYNYWKRWKNCVLGNEKLGIKPIGLPPKDVVQ